MGNFLHIPCSLCFYLFGFIFYSGEFLLHIPCWLHFLCGEFRWLIPYWLYFYLGSFSYTSHACFIFRGGGGGGGGGGGIFLIFFFNLLYWGVSLTHPMLALFFFLIFNLGSFSYRSRAGFVFMRGLSLLASHIPYWLYFYLWSFSNTSHACFIFREGGGRGGSYTGEFLLHIPCWLYFIFIFLIYGFSLTDPVLASFLCGDFLLHIPYWLYLFFYLASFSYTSYTGFIFIWGVSLTHPMLAFCRGSFSYTSHDGFL